MNFERKRYLNILESARDNGQIKVLTGIRQCGKSYILTKYFDKLKNNFSSEQLLTYKLASIKNESFHKRDVFENEIRGKLTKDEPYYIYIDEVQMCSDFEGMLLSIREDFPNADFYITGSNSKMLSKDILNKLGTNGQEIKVYPLDLEEFNYFYKKLGKIDDNTDILEEYLRIGGMPSAVVNSNNAGGIFDTIKNTILKNDIIDRYTDVNAEVLERVIEYICSSYGTPFSIENVVSEINDKNITSNELKKYLKYLEDSFLIFPMKNIKLGISSLSEKQDNIVKYYVIDHALASRISSGIFNNGSRLENMVYLKLLRDDINEISLGRKRNEEKEIDFTFEKNSVRHMIQVTEKMDAGSSTEKREFESFKGKQGNKILITLKSYNGIYKNKDIDVVLLKDFLNGYKF